MYRSLCLHKEGNSNYKNISIRLKTAKSNIGKWTIRLSEMMNQRKKTELNGLQKTQDPRVCLVEPKFNFEKLYHENHMNGDTRPMARDGDQIAFYVEREIGMDFFYDF